MTADAIHSIVIENRRFAFVAVTFWYLAEIRGVSLGQPWLHCTTICH
jgi:hypothetical protein